MKKIALKCGLTVSEIGFGALTVGPWQRNLSVEEGARVIRYALERGIHFIDTAQYYKTYPYIKAALKDYHGDLVMMTKSLDVTYDEMKFAVEEARSEMGLDTIDIFLLHELREGSDWEDRSGAWEYLKEAKAKGLVKAIGISTHHVDVTEFAAGVSEIDVVFPLINITGIGIRNGTEKGTRAQMEAAILKASQAGKDIIAMKVFGGGNLTSKYQDAFRYVKALPGIDAMMIGIGYLEEVDRIIEMAENKIDPAYVPDLLSKRVQIDQGDCMGCQSCVDRCPNKAIFTNDSGLCDINHEICITCGYCAPVCPYMAIIMY